MPTTFDPPIIALPSMVRTPLFLDNFNGPMGSNLVARVPDIGPSWGDMTYYPTVMVEDYIDGSTAAALARVELDGAGGMWAKSADDQAFGITIPVLVPAGNGYYEQSFTFSEPVLTTYYSFFAFALLGIKFDGNTPIDETYGQIGPSFEFNIDATGFQVGYAGDAYTPSGFRNYLDYMVIDPGVTYTVTVLISPTGLKVYVASDQGFNGQSSFSTVAVEETIGDYYSATDWPLTKFAVGGSGGVFFNSVDYEGGSFTNISEAPAKITKMEIGTYVLGDVPIGNPPDRRMLVL